MNNRIFFQITGPALCIGLLLLGSCLVSAWYIQRLQRNIANLLSENVASLQAAQELEIRVRQLRFHSFIFLIDPRPERLPPIEKDHQQIEEALSLARQAAKAPRALTCVYAIEDGYHKYHDELAELRHDVAQHPLPKDLGKLMDAHPVRYVVEPCQDLLRVSKEEMQEASQENVRVGGQARIAMLLLGWGGPASGLLVGYAIARGLSRSIYRLSVRLQNVAQHLDQDVASINITADGDLQNLDKQLEHITSRVEDMAGRLQRHQREMLRAEQLSAVGQLAASVAHEVRNPLTAAKMLVEVALRPKNPLPLTDVDLRVIHGEIARVEQTVQNLLNFARLPAPQRTRGDLRQVVEQALGLIRARARQQKVHVEVRTPPTPVVAAVDRNQICTVLVNLGLNALDAMPTGGRLELDLQFTSPGTIKLVVADTGAGIAPEISKRLFTPFVSTKETGTGLGLSISRRIIEEHGGLLAASNRPEGGACFTITLPGSGENGQLTG